MEDFEVALYEFDGNYFSQEPRKESTVVHFDAESIKVLLTALDPSQLDDWLTSFVLTNNPVNSWCLIMATACRNIWVEKILDESEANPTVFTSMLMDEALSDSFFLLSNHVEQLVKKNQRVLIDEILKESRKLDARAEAVRSSLEVPKSDLLAGFNPDKTEYFIWFKNSEANYSDNVEASAYGPLLNETRIHRDTDAWICRPPLWLAEVAFDKFSAVGILDFIPITKDFTTEVITTAFGLLDPYDETRKLSEVFKTALALS